MTPFRLVRPKTVPEAAQALADFEEPKLLAGGQTLVPTMRQGLAAPATLIDLGGVADLSRLRIGTNEIVVGATCSHASVAASPDVMRAVPGLARLAGMIGDPLVRNRGTIGGSIANNDPAADYPAACLALGATIVTQHREIAADDFFLGLFETALEEGEIITAVRFPFCEASAYEKFRNPASRFALAGVFVARRDDAVRVGVTGAGSDGVFRWEEGERALAQNHSLERIAPPAADAMLSDIHARGDYRAHLVKVLAQRAYDACDVA